MENKLVFRSEIFIGSTCRLLKRENALFAQAVALDGMIYKAQCQHPLPADLNCDPATGLEPGTLQPLTGQTDFWRDGAALEIAAGFNLEVARFHTASLSGCSNFLLRMTTGMVCCWTHAFERLFLEPEIGMHT
jgi:hypothetical protein